MATPSVLCSPERARLSALRAKHNYEVMYMFMGLIFGLVGVMVLFHLSRVVGKKLWPEKYPSRSPSFLVRLSRYNVAPRKVVSCHERVVYMVQQQD